MKLVILFNTRLPTPRAHGWQVVKMAEAFSQTGAKVELWRPEIPSGFEEDIFNFYGVGKTFQDKKIWCLNLSEKIFPAGLVYRMRYLTFLFRLLFVKKEKSWVFFTRHPEVAWVLSHFGFKTIFELHNWIIRKKKINQFLLKKVSLIIATTNLIKREMIANGFGADNILVAPHGVELEKFNLGLTVTTARQKLALPLDKKIIVYTGALYQQKGIATIIEAARSLPEDYQLCLIGGLPQDIERIKSVAADLPALCVLGAKKHDQIPFYLQAADILLIANSGQDTVESRFTAPLKLFEYLASGRPIVASDVPAIREFLNEETAVLVKPDDPAILAKALASLANDKDKQVKLAANGLAQAKKFNWQNRAQKIMEAIEKLNDRRQVLQSIINYADAKNYLEIGVEYGTIFTRLKVVKKIAVDPNLQVSRVRKLIDFWQGRRAKYFNLTSDDFFAWHSDLFKDEKIDVAFIDGLHTYEQSLRDVENCLKFLSPRGVVIVHDCNPQSAAAAQSKRPPAEESRKWNGDVWKTIVHLRSQRNDLKVFVLDSDQGLGIISFGQPENGLNETPYIPLGLISLGAYIRNDFDVKIVDLRFLSPEKLLTLVKEARPLAVCFSMLTGSCILQILSVSRQIKAIDQQIKIIVGGIHPTFFPAQTVTHPLIDFAVINEGEKVLLELLVSLEKNEDFFQIEGLAWKDKKGQVMINEPAKTFLDMNLLPLPAWDLIEVEQYTKKLSKNPGEKVLDFYTSKGCPFPCSFCYNLRFNRRSWRARSAERAVEEMEMLYKKYGVNYFIIHDDNFVTDKNRALKFSELVKSRGMKVRYSIDSRIDYFDYDFLKNLKESGLCELRVGCESGSNRVLQEVVQKGITAEQIVEAVEIAKSLDLKLILSFVIGWPTETKIERQATIDLIMKLQKIHPRTAIYPLWIYIPYAGTPLFDQAVDLGFKAPQNLEEWGNYFWGKAHIPWLDNRREYEIIHELSPFAWYNKKLKDLKNRSVANLLRHCLIKIFRPLVVFRFRYNFWKFPIEAELIIFLKKLVQAFLKKSKAS